MPHRLEKHEALAHLKLEGPGRSGGVRHMTRVAFVSEQVGWLIPRQIGRLAISRPSLLTASFAWRNKIRLFVGRTYKVAQKKRALRHFVVCPTNSPIALLVRKPAASRAELALKKNSHRECSIQTGLSRHQFSTWHSATSR